MPSEARRASQYSRRVVTGKDAECSNRYVCARRVVRSGPYGFDSPEDTGAQVQPWFGSGAYEHSLVVKAEHVSKLFSVLTVSSSQVPDLPHILKLRFDEGLHDSFEDLRRRLRSKRIPSDFWSRIDD